jgi:hypothetical protein
MQHLSMIPSANTEAMAMIAIGLVSAVLMVWFLIALWWDARRITKAKPLTLRKKSLSSAVIRRESPRNGRGESAEEQIDGEENGPSRWHARLPHLDIY